MAGVGGALIDVCRRVALTHREPQQPTIGLFLGGWDTNTADALSPGRVPLKTIAKALGQWGPKPAFEFLPKLENS